MNAAVQVGFRNIPCLVFCPQEEIDIFWCVNGNSKIADMHPLLRASPRRVSGEKPLSHMKSAFDGIRCGLIDNQTGAAFIHIIELTHQPESGGDGINGHFVFGDGQIAVSAAAPRIIPGVDLKIGPALIEF